VPFQEHAAAGEGVHARIEGGERAQRAEDEVAVMNHAMRMAIGLSVEGVFRLVLVPGTQVGVAALVRP